MNRYSEAHNGPVSDDGDPEAIEIFHSLADVDVRPAPQEIDADEIAELLAGHESSEDSHD
jgi:hypothetical protein